MDKRNALDKNSSLPLHQQLKDEIRNRITGGEYKTGEKIPSTSELCAVYDISITTVRRAVTELITEGVLQGLPGKGTFVVSAFRKEKGARESKLVGLIFPGSTSSDFFLEIFQGIENELRGHGYHLVSTVSDNDPEKERWALIELREKGVEGIILTPGVSNRTSAVDRTLREFLEQDFPIVLLDRKIPHFSTDYVATDNETGGWQATQHLLCLGHTRVAFISCSVANTVQERLKGYRRAFTEAGINVNPLMVKRGYYGEDENSGYSGAMELLNLAVPPTAILASNDVIALGVYRACHEMNIDIPKDLSVIGYDNLPYAGSLLPPLTTIHQPKYEMGQRAGEILLRRINGEKGGPEEVILKSHLLERGSCVKPNEERNVSQPLAAVERGGDESLPDMGGK